MGGVDTRRWWDHARRHGKREEAAYSGEKDTPVASSSSTMDTSGTSASGRVEGDIMGGVEGESGVSSMLASWVL